MAKKYLVVEAHLQIDETVLNPHLVGPAVAKKVQALLDETYGAKDAASEKTQSGSGTVVKKTKAHTRQVHTLAVTYRSAAIVDTDE